MYSNQVFYYIEHSLRDRRALILGKNSPDQTAYIKYLCINYSSARAKHMQEPSRFENLRNLLRSNFNNESSIRSSSVRIQIKLLLTEYKPTFLKLKYSHNQ